MLRGTDKILELLFIRYENMIIRLERNCGMGKWIMNISQKQCSYFCNKSYHNRKDLNSKDAVFLLLSNFVVIMSFSSLTHVDVEVFCILYLAFMCNDLAQINNDTNTMT